MLKTIFDPDHYRAQIDRDLDDAAALRDFRQHGDARGLDPSPYFATRWYKQRYGDWSDGGAATAAEDFLHHLSQAASRQPHPLIDPDYYRAAYPDLAGLGARAVLHFMRHGDDEGRAPSRAFDAAFYRRCYLPLGQRRAFAHYIRHGAALGYRP